ncbi:hypothetical protein JW835_14290 [bacterium]|nr:hypothetical protein [bacterium]
MIYLAGEMLICLFVSMIIGFVTGWLLRGVGLKRKLKNIENLYQINLASLKSKNTSVS